MMKKRIAQVIGLVVGVVVVCVLAITCTQDKIHIEDEDTPLVDGIGVLLTEQAEDIVVIPDKYNTGAKGELTPVTSECYIAGIKLGTTGGVDRKLDLYYQPKNVVIPSEILIENCDFSSGGFREYSVDKVQQEVTIIYRNCKFQSYKISGSGLVKRIFENCTFTHFEGSDATFINCYFGGGTQGDGINPIKNCTFENCMIADLIQPASVAGSKHIDGFQIFGNTDGVDNTNIVLNNCRFEVPYIPMTAPSGALNCPVAIIMRYSNADNIQFNDCYVNGGLYYGVMVSEVNQTVNNLTIKNMRVGGNSKSIYNCEAKFETILSENISATDSLYVASVRKMDDGIHLSVTNDTLEERVLSVVTDAGVEKFTIQACYRGIDLANDEVTYQDFPFDKEIVIKNAEWVACFDTTNDLKQIRFVNWSGKDVYANLDVLVPEKVNEEKEVVESTTEEQEPIIEEEPSVESDNESLEGSCGEFVTFYLNDGVLVIEGEGNIYDYHSDKLPPWYEMKDSIVEVQIKEGVSRLGNQMFVECSKLTTVVLPEGLTEIGGNVFKKCNAMQYIYIPSTLEKVGARSFTSAVGSVEYAGTQEEWQNIAIEANNNGLLNANISYKQ